MIYQTLSKYHFISRMPNQSAFFDHTGLVHGGRKAYVMNNSLETSCPSEVLPSLWLRTQQWNQASPDSDTN